jgi:Single-strand binding protein family
LPECLVVEQPRYVNKSSTIFDDCPDGEVKIAFQPRLKGLRLVVQLFHRVNNTVRSQRDVVPPGPIHIQQVEPKRSVLIDLKQDDVPCTVLRCQPDDALGKPAMRINDHPWGPVFKIREDEVLEEGGLPRPGFADDRDASVSVLVAEPDRLTGLPVVPQLDVVALRGSTAATRGGDDARSGLVQVVESDVRAHGCAPPPWRRETMDATGVDAPARIALLFRDQCSEQPRLLCTAIDNSVTDLYNRVTKMPETPSHFNEFDASKVGEALGAEPRSTRDVAHGDGKVLDVGDATLEVYQDAGVARVTTPDARIELYRVPSYTISGERVIFEQGDQGDRTRLQVRADGKVAFHPVLRAVESPTAGETALSGQQLPATAPAVFESTTRRPDAAAPTAPEVKEPPEVQLTGRLGRDPWYIPRDEGPVAGFPLAVNDQQGKTTWHKVVVAGELADQVKTGLQTGQIKKGRLVELHGTQVTRQEDNGKGGTRTTTEIHATSITRLRNSTVPHPQGR